MRGAAKKIGLSRLNLTSLRKKEQNEILFANTQWRRIFLHSPRGSNLHTHTTPKTSSLRAKRIVGVQQEKKGNKNVGYRKSVQASNFP